MVQRTRRRVVKVVVDISKQRQEERLARQGRHGLGLSFVVGVPLIYEMNVLLDQLYNGFYVLGAEPRNHVGHDEREQQSDT